MIKLFYHPLSFPSFAPIFTAQAMDIPYEKVIIDFKVKEQKTPEFLAINTYGRVPAMQDGSYSMGESASIMRYLARKEGSSLYSGSLEEQGNIDKWLDFVNHHIRSSAARVHFNRIVGPWLGDKPNEASIEIGLHSLKNDLPVIETRLSDHAFLCADKMTLADIALVAALEPETMAKIDLSDYPNLINWLKARRSEPFYTKVHSHFGAELEP